jgi:hypothetical protein
MQVKIISHNVKIVLQRIAFKGTIMLFEVQECWRKTSEAKKSCLKKIAGVLFIIRQSNA